MLRSGLRTRGRPTLWPDRSSAARRPRKPYAASGSSAGVSGSSAGNSDSFLATSAAFTAVPQASGMSCMRR